MFPSPLGRGRGEVYLSSRRRHTRFDCDWSSDVCSSDLVDLRGAPSSGAVAQWLNTPQPMRSIGAIYSGDTPDAYFGLVSPHSFDVIFFVERTKIGRAHV